jgi:NAD(P)-dependent dehydrogenase (short-subunit alcohol dehydrogenase family)
MAIQSRIAAVTGANKGIGLAIGILYFLPSNSIE